MIKVSRIYHGEAKELILDENPSISITGDGEILWELSKYDGRAAALQIKISPVELKRIQEACNKALERITGRKYTTQVH